jgi:uncharacterized Zn-binding protein involved in type VI secretion
LKTRSPVIVVPLAPGVPAAKKGDQVVGTDVHVLMVPTPGGPVPTPTPMPFAGVLDGALSADIVCEDQPLALQGSTASNQPAHVPAAGPFQKPPANRGTIQIGSMTVMANDKPVARAGDVAVTCCDPADAPNGKVVAVGTVLVG